MCPMWVQVLLLYILCTSSSFVTYLLYYGGTWLIQVQYIIQQRKIFRSRYFVWSPPQGADISVKKASIPPVPTSGLSNLNRAHEQWSNRDTNLHKKERMKRKERRKEGRKRKENQTDRVFPMFSTGRWFSGTAVNFSKGDPYLPYWLQQHEHVHSNTGTYMLK